MSDATAAEEKLASSGPEFITFEHQILEFWSKEQCFERLVEKLKGRPLFRFLDGPITANNPMGVHHAWGRMLKDAALRYHSLRGYNCHFQNGFDCQGLWVEVEVEKELGFRGKPDIEAYGLDKFSAACKARVQKFSSIQTQQSTRLGQWMDWKNSYYTHTDRNIEGIWMFLKKCHENGWLYRSYLPMPWCARCGTSLSEHEMTGSYKDLKHLAVYVQLRVPELGSRILVWTTTPWTLPANTALAVNPSLTYAQIRLEDHDEPLILSADVLSGWDKKKRPHETLKTMSGKELVGLSYEPIFADLPVQQFPHKIVPWDEVDPSEGTGVVHIAPGCGREDFELSKQIKIERLVPIDEKGDYLKGFGFLEGKNCQEVAEEVAAYLNQNGKLFRKYMHEHSYPVCWRCKQELVFRLVGEWYISTEKIRPRLLEAAKEVKWQPEYVGKRMEDWLRNMGDWCISRKRFWGLPLPFYCCECGETTVAGSRQELQSLSKQDVAAVPELHRPWIDEIKINCPKCSREVSRVTEVGDCWLDAGIVPFSTAGCYDGDNRWGPADWICEMSEQVRLWFYSQLFMGVTLTGHAPYKHVTTHESVRAEDGSKFSKTGYMIRFDEAAEQMGVDTMRYYFASQPPTNDLRFGYGVGDETRRHLISLWNVYSFFETYASIDKPNLSAMGDMSKSVLPIDHWLLASLVHFIEQAKKAYDNYQPALVVREFEDFVDGLSNWYIRSNRRRFWKSETGTEKLVGYWALFQAIKTSVIAMSPIIPFLTEKIWQLCVRRYDRCAPLSVHLSDWPALPQEWTDEKLVARVARARQVINLAHRLRSESKIKVRQPLSTLYALVPEDYKEACEGLEQVILSELNVKNLRFLRDKAELFTEYLELDLRKAGPVLKGDVSKVVSEVNGLGGTVLPVIVSAVRSGETVRLPEYGADLPASIFVVRTRTRPNVVSMEEGKIFLALDTSISPELEEEGWIRDTLRFCQVLRKDSGLEVQDRIELALVTDSERLRHALLKHRRLIEDETLGTLRFEPIAKPQGESNVSVGGEKLSITLGKRA